MARGESEAAGRRGTGVAIWAIFGVACLFTAFLVIRATGEPDAEPYELEMREPFPGAEGTSRLLGWRGCTGLHGPAVPGTAATTGGHQARLERDLGARGYEALGEWSDPVSLPITDSYPDLIGKCGVVAVVTDGSGWLTHAGDYPVCLSDATTVGVCGTEEARFVGSGTVRVRVFEMPGLSDGDPARTGMPSEALLAHAEAEVMLSHGGWTAGLAIVEETVAPRSGNHALTPPTRPGSGCVPYVAVGLGIGSARTSWLGRNVAWSNAERRFVVAAIACAGSGMFGNRVTQVDVRDDNRGGTVWWRPYDATTAGPSTAGSAATTTIGAATTAAATGLALPPSVDDVFDD